MNNYLTSIAARILVAAPVVRPRMGGHFEPPSASIDDAKSLPRNATNPLHVAEKREQIVTEAPKQRDSDAQSERSFEPPSQSDHPRTLESELKSEATTAPQGTNSIADATATPREPDQQAIAQSPQGASVETRPIEGIDVTENREFRRQIRDDSAAGNWSSPRSEEPAPVPVQEPVAERVDLKPVPAVKPLIANDERRSAAPPATKPLGERELETIVVREQAKPVQSALHPASAKPSETPISTDARENGESKPPVAVVHSKIAPLIERAPQPLPTNRRASQPQPTIHVTIGRVEVRAVQSPQAQTKSQVPTPVMNLDDYLKRRSQGNTR